MKQTVQYDLGLDIGIASVGWCVLGDSRILDLGVRCFDAAENDKGKPLNTERRTARLQRRRLRRRAYRLLKLARLLRREGLITDARLFQKQTPVTPSLWALRVAALDRCLDGEEWARVLYHLCKHRGFWFARKSEAAASEGGKVKQGLEHTQHLIQQHQSRTAAEMMLTAFPEHQRNKRGDYGQSLSRAVLGEELTTLFAAQRALGNPFAHAGLEHALLDRKTGLFWLQKPALSGEAMLKMIGHCTFEPTEYRAAKRSWTAERFVWLTRLNNLRLNVAGDVRPLTAAERQCVLDLPYRFASVTYKKLKDTLVKAGLLPAAVYFQGLRYREGEKPPEAAVLIALPGYHDLRKALEDSGLKTEWHSLATQSAILDRIATVLSVYKTDEEIATQLAALSLMPAVIAALQTVGFSDFIRLSCKALSRILPGMEDGLRYDEACTQAGYHHSGAPLTQAACRYLPMLDDEAPNNPVVRRAINQARKVINALIGQYGAPRLIHIEMARDLSRPLDERQDIEKTQETYQKERTEARALFTESFNQAPNAKNLEKWQLYREQTGKCAYSLHALNVARLFEQGYVEVDHVLPYSRSFDDSKANKVLVLTEENRNKGNCTPYEFLDGANHSPRWQAFEAFVRANKGYRQAKRERLLRKQFDADAASEFKARNLNDTRYICRYVKNFIERHLALHPDSGYQRCVVVSGQLTSFLRARWGLAKVRDASDRHHALDAAVVAACSHAMVKKLSDYARRKELAQARTGFIDVETGEVLDVAMLRQLDQHFPRPWPHFDDELCVRLGMDRSGNPLPTEDVADQHRHLAALGYPEAALAALKPLFVSRAPQRRNGGAVHKDTIYAQPERLKASGGITEKVPLAKLNLADIDKLVDAHRNQKLYAALRTRLEDFGGKGGKAFPAGYVFRKPDKTGAPTGPVVRTVTLERDKLSGIPIRGGVAKNDSMIRVDVFSKAGKFHLVPLYPHHRLAASLPDRAVVADKPEAEWTLMDSSFTFCFSLYPNDLVRICFKGKPTVLGYYRRMNRTNGQVEVMAHDRNKAVGKDGLFRIGVKLAVSMEKFHVGLLGQIFPAAPEVRHGVA